MKKLAVLGLALIASAVVIALPAAGHNASAATHGVSITDYAFTDASSSTATTTITAGESVMWTWNGTDIHSVTADDGSFDHPSGSAQSAGTFSMTFNSPGTYAYYCRVHGGPGGQGMSGTVVVQAAAATDTPAATATSTSVAATMTPTSTRTPDSSVTATSTPSHTPEGTATPDNQTTPVPPTVVSAPSIAPAGGAPAGGAAGAGSLPRAGDGVPGGTSRLPLLSLVLALAGATVLAAAAFSPRRR